MAPGTMNIADIISRNLNPGVLGGVTLGGWLRLLAENRFAVDPRRLPRAAVITMLSLGNSLAASAENLVHRRGIERTELSPPLFVLGIWRSGTTLLQNLLSLDPGRATPDFFQVRFPHTFLLAEPLVTRFFRGLPAGRRAQDRVALGWRVPGEDEVALCVLCGRSPILGGVFPSRRSAYVRYHSFEGVPEGEIEKWRQAFAGFVRKLSYAHGKPLLLKSPSHTARLRLLTAMFPGARYVHISRNPYDVFRSASHTARTVTPHRALQKLTGVDLDEELIRLQKLVGNAYLDCRHLVSEGHLWEISFEDLVRDPVGTVRGIYEGLGLEGYREVAPLLLAQAPALAAYRRNRYPELPPPLRRRLAGELGRFFTEWGYPT